MPNAPIIPDEIRALTYALWIPGQARPALEALGRRPHPAAAPALCDLIEASADPREIAAAVRALGRLKPTDPAVSRGLWRAAAHPSGPVRLEATRILARDARPCDPEVRARWRALLQRDPAPLIRRVALKTFDALDPLVAALDDPVWRVRRDVAHRLLALAAEDRAPLVERLTPLLEAPHPAWRDHRGGSRRGQAAAAYVLACLEGRLEVEAPAPPPWAEASWWADDPAVMVAQLRHRPAASLAEDLGLLVALVGHQDGYPLDDWMGELRRVVAGVLLAAGDVAAWVDALGWLADPRVPYAVAWAEALADRWREAADPAVAEGLPAAAWAAEGVPTEAKIWAVQRMDTAGLSAIAADACAHPEAAIRRAAIAQIVARGLPSSPETRRRWLSDPDEAVAEAAVAAQGAPLAQWIHALPPSRLGLILAEPGALASLDVEAWRRASRRWPRRVAEALAAAAEAGRLGARPALAGVLRDLAEHPDYTVRAAALTPASAQSVIREARREPSWRALARAAALTGRPLAALAPALVRDLQPQPITRAPLQHTGPYFPLRLGARQWRPPAQRPSLETSALEISALEISSAEPSIARRLGGEPISPIAISGRYGLPEEGYELALSQGVTTFFWEPEYANLTRWLRSLPVATRRRLSIIAGTFASEPRDVARDLEQTLHLLGVPKITAFILFWVRSMARLSDGVAELLWSARARGQVATFGLSTHDRALALRAIEDGWPTIMIRHSAGHPGAEAEVMPRAAAAGAEIITFSNLCYGQMLRTRGGQPLPFTAADCYRYALSQPGVRLSLSAPRTVKQLQENLDVLRQTTLSAARQQAMRAYTRPIRAETRRLIRLLRNVDG